MTIHETSVFGGKSHTCNTVIAAIFIRLIFTNSMLLLDKWF